MPKRPTVSLSVSAFTGLVLPLLAGLGPAAAVTQMPVSPPAGAIAFCTRNPSFCVRHEPASLPASQMDLLNRVNRQVNSQLVPEPLSTDQQKVAENRDWRVVVPSDPAGCVEYTWTKYFLLAWSGVPMGAMRFAEVNIPSRDELHAVLLVNVNGVFMVMDNLTPSIQPADAVRYDWIAVQDLSADWQWTKPARAP